ncbi:RNA-binding cell elongation regulator Jag/EloR [Bacillus sp. CGMCC 1.16541]|uniref:RNA-binding cell elongation regulator Jag/EloR n=1 Tax=Bacillus sp. CGMCC 1.16541 TaxID=2185143 RepID=UPI000D73C8A8|nr:RNA-binding cell elongation regulator Jag/EloR [Bacillus sp. CGMCC 1.16541]
MNQLTATGQTVDEAVKYGLAQLGVSKDKVKIEVLDVGKKGFLGIFKSKPAVVRIEVLQDPIEEAEMFLKSVSKEMNVEIEIEVIQRAREYEFKIRGKEIGVLIGKRGQTLNALQVLTQIVANRYSSHYITIMLNPEGYREKRKEILENLALKMAKHATKTHKAVHLEPMPSYERKVIHHILAHHSSVRSSSTGREPNRSVVIEPKSPR